MHATEAPGRFWRSVGVVLSGAAAAQAIPLIGSLVLARLVAPAHFGLFAAWLGMAHLAAVVITGRYENALALEHDGEPRRIGAAATLVLALAGGSVLTLLSLAVAAFSPPWAGGVGTTLLLAFGPTAVLIAAAYLWQCRAAADGQFRALSAMRIAQAAAITVLQIVACTWTSGAEALALAHAAGIAIGLATAAWRLPPGRPPGWGAMRDFWSRHHRFPMLSLPADSVNTAASQLPLLIVAHRFGADVAGLLALTLRTLGAPVALLGASVLDVFKRRAAGAYRERGECRAEFVETFKGLGIAALVFAVVVGLSAEPLFALAFGEAWRGAGTIALWLMPLFALRFVASPLSYLFYVAGKQHVDLAWQCALLAVTMASLWIPAQSASALQWYSASYSTMYLVYLFLSYRFSLGHRP